MVDRLKSAATKVVTHRDTTEIEDFERRTLVDDVGSVPLPESLYALLASVRTTATQIRTLSAALRGYAASDEITELARKFDQLATHTAIAAAELEQTIRDADDYYVPRIWTGCMRAMEINYLLAQLVDELRAILPEEKASDWTSLPGLPTRQLQAAG
ncbi:hypothetical protein [Fimbriiglobus ruber]|uniref:Uncharacterized protein n=1 Tax=Fimbriiglobus ruber TaxID=1908690 RepID=A0A225DYE1_9BACT|nr:hypothetical protein [Fimbriiglobus ruber]OWK46550.1 hypothetical protein FRUB_00249 [Fimbriiglobus ruber]